MIISEATKSRIGDEFDTEDLGPQMLKNVPQPIRAYRLAHHPAGEADQLAPSAG